VVHDKDIVAMVGCSVRFYRISGTDSAMSPGNLAMDS
jgi:hypothetical protein